MIASIYVIAGYQTMRSPERVVKQADPVVHALAEYVDFVPDDTEQAVRVNAAVQVAGGALLAIGWLPRLAALALAATLIPTTAAGHRFWEYDDPQERAQQRIHFLKNLSMLGGLLMVAADSGDRRTGRVPGR
jgi:putative oxidoreductase